MHVILAFVVVVHLEIKRIYLIAAMVWGGVISTYTTSQIKNKTLSGSYLNNSIRDTDVFGADTLSDCCQLLTDQIDIPYYNILGSAAEKINMTRSQK